MPINIPVPVDVDQPRPLSQLLRDILRRAVDGTLNPIQINVQINVTGNDIKIVTAGKGVILPVGNTGNYARVTLDNDYAIDIVPL